MSEYIDKSKLYDKLTAARRLIAAWNRRASDEQIH